MKVISHICLLLLQLLPVCGFAQTGLFKNYTISDGLVNNSIRRIYQDSEGFIWICTWEGLSRYDGHKFVNYTTENGLSENMINDIIEVRPGEFYVATNGGGVDILENGRVNKAAAFGKFTVNRFFMASRQKLLALTDVEGICEIRDRQLIRNPAQPSASYSGLVEIDSNYLLCSDPGPVMVINKNFSFWKQGESRAGVPFNIHKDRKDRIWVCTTGGLKLLEYFNGSIRYLPLPPPFNTPSLSQAWVNSMIEEEDGTLWFATRGEGLVKVSPQGMLQVFDERNGLPASSVTCFFKDREKNLWIGTDVGLARLSQYFPINAVPYEPVDTTEVISVNKIDNSIFIATTPSLYRYLPHNQAYRHLLRFKDYAGIVLVKNSSPAKLLDSKGLFVLDEQNGTVKKLVNWNINPGITHAVELNGTIFIAFIGGMVMYRDGKFSSIVDFPHRMTSITADKNGIVWVGTWSEGLFKVHFDEKDQQLKIEANDIKPALPDKCIRALFFDSHNNFWIGTRYSGVVMIRKEANGAYAASQYSTGNGLSSIWATGFDEDEDGSIWVANQGGISKIVRRGDHYRAFNFGRVSGFYLPVTSLVTLPGRIVFGSSYKGLARVHDSGMENISPMQVKLTSIGIGPNSFLQNESRLTDLNHKQNNIAFEFSCAGFINEKEMLYSYRLRGSGDTTWSIPANLHSVQYASLQPGHYEFEVKNVGWNGEPGTPTTFQFVIHPPFWQRWWFYGIIIAILATGFYLFYRYRLEQIIKLQKVRNNIAKDLHDDIGSSLTNISILSELSKKNLEEPHTARIFLHRIAEESNQSQQALDDIIWSVNVRNDTFEQTTARMRRYAADLFDNSFTECHLDLENIDSHQRLNMEQRRDLFLIYKECLNNICKHADAKNVWINVWRKGSQVHMRIKDDGRGFDVIQPTTRNGIANMNARTKKWKGLFDLSSDPKKGTVVEISMPLVE